MALDLDLQETPTIRGNAAELSQVIMNLLVNAWHAMLGSETRRLTVRTRLEGEQVVFAVEDTGCGIPAEYRERIFHPMFSLKGEHAPPGSPLADVRGTGLGLSLSATVVKAHGGELDIESEEGVGTTVTVRLPAAASGPDAPTATGTPDNL
ncbi:MAG: sensor histidine kinase [Planctomycetota bacterium]